MNIINKFVGMKCLTDTKIQILYDHVDHTHFHIVEMGYQMVQLSSSYIAGPMMFVNLTPALGLGFSCLAKSYFKISCHINGVARL